MTKKSKPIEKNSKVFNFCPWKLSTDIDFVLRMLEKKIFFVPTHFLQNENDFIKILKVYPECYKHLPLTMKKKKKIISFVGKLNKAKGYDIFGKTIIKILDKYPDWTANVFGDEPREKLIFKHKNLHLFGFKNNKWIDSIFLQKNL